MQKNWKTAFSKCIFDYNNEIKIYDNYVYRWLTFASPYIQTLISQFKPHRPELQYMRPLTIAARRQKNKTCLFGLGGGGLVHYLNNLEIDLTVIENNNLVIDLAHKYFFLNTLQNFHVEKINALEFVKVTAEKYAHLLIDIHDAYNFPEECLNFEFFASCKKILNPNGVLAINICNMQDLCTVHKFLKAIYQNKIILIPIKGYANTILIASEDYSLNNILKIYSHNPEINALTWDEKFGYIATFNHRTG